MLIPAAAVFSALIAATVGFEARHQNKQHLIIQNSFEALKERRTPQFSKSLRSVIKFKVYFKEVYDPEKPEYSEAWVLETMEGHIRADVAYLMNYFEELALGINNDLYDYGIVTKSIGLILRDIWDSIQPIIKESREHAAHEVINIAGEKYIPYTSFQELAIKLGGVKC